MPDLIFGHPSGAVAHISGANHGKMSCIELEGSSKLANGDIDILITGIAVSQQVKVAYFSTLGDAMYVYPLGNEMSKAVVSGMALPASICTSTGTRDYGAAKKLIDFYDKNKASNFNAVARPIKLHIPPVPPLEGFIEGMSLEIGSGAADFGFAKFTINLSIIPK